MSKKKTDPPVQDAGIGIRLPVSHHIARSTHSAIVLAAVKCANHWTDVTRMTEAEFKASVAAWRKAPAK